jgi:hypothetical protein
VIFFAVSLRGEGEQPRTSSVCCPTSKKKEEESIVSPTARMTPQRGVGVGEEGLQLEWETMPLTQKLLLLPFQHFALFLRFSF